MIWHQLLWGENCVGNPLIADEVQLGDTTQAELEAGEPIGSWVEKAVLRVKDPTNDGNPDDALMNNLALLVFSQRFQSAIHAHGIRGIEFLPVRVFRHGGVLISGYAIANVINLVPALDHKLSTYHRYEPDFPQPELRGRLSLTKAVLTGEKLVGYDIFRLKEDTGYVFVSEAFRKIVLKHKLTGVGFARVHVVGGISCGSSSRIESRTAHPRASDLDAIAVIVGKASSAATAWKELSAWFLTRGIDISQVVSGRNLVSELANIRRQLLQILNSEPVPKSITFLYFGIFDISGSESRVGFYVSGGDKFVPEDSDSLCEPPFLPADRFICSEGLNAIKTWAMREPSKRALVEYSAIFGLSAVLARFGVPKAFSRKQIIVGFDEGDFAVVQ